MNSKWIWVLAVVSLFFTAFVVQHSFERGRLQYEVDYEDVITFLDGLKRYRLLVDEGQGRLQFFQHYLADPPHAPLHSLQAMLAFTFLGIHDWAPYVSNGVLLFALLSALVFALRDSGSWAKAAGLFFLLCTPLAYHTVEEFRPDYPSAIATVWGILLYFQFIENRSHGMAMASGACFALAMLAKPPVFPYVLAMGGGPFFWGLYAGFRSGGWQGLRRHAFVAWPFFAACALVVGPHFIVAARKIVDYFVLNQLGADSHLWAFNEGWGQRIAYHITGYGGWLGLGRHWVLALGLWGCAVGVGLLRRSESIPPILIPLTGMTIWAYLFLVVNPHMNPFFGITFQILLLFSGAVFLAWLVDFSCQKWISMILKVLALGVVGIAFLLAFCLPVRKSEFTLGPASHKAFVQNANRQVMDILEKHRDSTEGGYTLVSSYGVVSSHTLQWMADKEEKNFRIEGVPYESIETVQGLFDHNTGLERVDFAIVSEPGILGGHVFLPNAQTSGPLLSYLRGHDEYLEIGHVPDPNGKSYFIFLRKPRSVAPDA